LGAVPAYTFTNVTANHTIEASFFLNEFIIIATAGSNGAINPSGTTTVNAGQNQTFNILPNTGYHIADVIVDGISVGPVSSYAFVNVMQNHTIHATFEINTYTINASAGSGGNINPQGVITVNYLGSQLFEVEPQTGFYISDLLVDGVSVGAFSSYLFINVSSNHTIHAEFEPFIYTLQYLAGAHGTISGNTTQYVAHGNNGTAVEAIPDPNYHFVNWSDGSTANPRTDMNVAGNLLVTANFAINTHTIMATAGPNGSINPSGNITVPHGGSQSFTITAAANYQIEDVLVNGISVGAVVSYQFVNVTENQSIHAIFTLNTYTITATAAANGSISPSGDITVVYGENQSFTITAANGYHITDVLIDGSSVGAVSSYEFQNVTGNHTIHASFALNTYTIVAVSGPGGNILPSGVVTVNHGSNQSFNMIPNTGYHVSNVNVDGVSIGAVTSYEFVNITTNHSIQVSFAINNYTITASAGANGSISPSGTISLEHGANQQFTIAPEQGYHIDDVMVDGVSVGAVSSYEFVNIVQNHSIHATFAINTYIIIASSSDYGTIEPAGEVLVTHGSNQLFTFTPQPNYAVKEVIIDNINHGELDNYEFVNITADHSIHVVFDLIESLFAYQFDGLAFKLYPNPVREILVLQIEHQPTNQTAYAYRIIQLDGSILMHHEIDGKLTNIPVDALAPGMYFVQLLNKGQVIQTEKLVKTH
jgi:ABC-type transporter MlaC component